MPVVVVALRNKRKPLGVLCVDTMGHMPRAPYDVPPDQAVVKFLESVGRSLGTVLDAHAKRECLRDLAFVAANPYTELHEVWETTFKGVCNCFPSLDGIAAVRVVAGRDSAIAKGSDLKEVTVERVAGPTAVTDSLLQRIDTFDPTRSSLKPVQRQADNVAWLVVRPVNTLARRQAKRRPTYGRRASLQPSPQVLVTRRRWALNRAYRGPIWAVDGL